MDRLKTDGPKMIILTCFNSIKDIFLFYGCWLESRKSDQWYTELQGCTTILGGVVLLGVGVAI